jgi:hypothetical protein
MIAVFNLLLAVSGATCLAEDLPQGDTGDPRTGHVASTNRHPIDASASTAFASAEREHLVADECKRAGLTSLRLLALLTPLEASHSLPLPGRPAHGSSLSWLSALTRRTVLRV